MDEKYNDELDLLKCGYFCDCCSTSQDVLFTLQGNCPITLCSECIKQFHSMLTKKKPGQIIKFFKRD